MAADTSLKISIGEFDDVNNLSWKGGEKDGMLIS